MASRRAFIIGAAAAVLAAITGELVVRRGEQPTRSVTPTTKLGVGVQGDNVIDEIQTFETLIGRPVKVVRRYMTWDEPLVDDTALWAAQTGHDAIIALESFTPTQAIRWTDVAAGKHDADLRAKGQQIISLAAQYPMMTIYLEYHHEPEDDVDSIAAQAACGRGPAEFRAASAHVRTVWRQLGVPFRTPKQPQRNVLYGHCLMSSTYRGGHGGAASWFPATGGGIQFMAADGYNRGPCDSPVRWKTFSDLFTAGHDFAKRRGVPFIIQECGLPENNAANPTKAGWFNDAHTVMKTWGSDLAVFEYSNVFSDHFTCDYQVDTTPASLAAYTSIAHDPLFDG